MTAESEMDRSPAPPIVPVQSLEAMRQLGRLLHAQAEGDFVANPAVVEFEQYYRRHPEQVIAAASHFFAAAEGSASALMCCALLGAAATVMPGGVRDSELVARVAAQLSRSLRSADCEERRLAAFAFAYMTAPPLDVAEQLASMARSEDVMERIFSASACSWYFVHDETASRFPGIPLEIHEALLAGLASEQALVIAMAARGVARMGSVADKQCACRALLARLPQEEKPGNIYHCIEAIGVVAEGVEEAKSLLIKYALDDAVLMAIRCMAARVLLGIALPSDAARILELLRAADVRIIEFVVLGLKERPGVCDVVVRCLADDWLVADDCDLREAAARVIGVIPGAPSMVVDKLMDRIGVEINYDVVDTIASALARASGDVVSAVMERAKTRNVASMAVAAGVLQKSGRAAVRAVVAAMRESGDPWLRGLLLAIVRASDTDTGEVVRDLAEALKEADEDPGVFLLHAIMAAGQAASAALPELVAILAVGDGPMVDHAERAIRSIGPDAVPFLDDACAAASGVVKERMERCRHWVEPIRVATRQRMRSVRDDTLQMFLYAGGALLSGPKSLEDLGEAIRAASKEGKLRRAFPNSSASISRAFKEISRSLGGGRHVVLSHGKKPMELTRLGQGLLMDVHKYCQQVGLA